MHLLFTIPRIRIKYNRIKKKKKRVQKQFIHFEYY